MKILILLIEIVIIVGILAYIFKAKIMKTTYSIHESNYYLGLKPQDEPKYLIHKVDSILGFEYMLSFIGKDGDSGGFDTYDEANKFLREYLRNNFVG